MLIRLGGLHPVFIGVLAIAQTSHAGVLDHFAKSKYPHNKGLSVVDAVNAAVWTNARGQQYLDVVAEETRIRNAKGGGGPLSPSQQCTMPELQKPSGEGINCVPAKADTEGCESEECIRIILPSGALDDVNYRRAVHQAIQSPCQFLIDPTAMRAIYNHKVHYVYGLSYPAEFSWNFLRCDSRNPVTGEVVSRNDDTLLLKFN
jgi:hypothetical protein